MVQNEDVLLRRFAVDGDREAFSELAGRHAAMVYGTCVRILEDNTQAADAAQETFYQLLKDAENISGSVGGWLHRVARGKAIDMIRKDSRRRARERKYAASTEVRAEKWEDLSGYIDDELDGLETEVKEVLLRRFFEGENAGELAEEMGVSQTTIYRRIETGVSQLRERLSKKGIIVAVGALMLLLEENALQAAPAILAKEIGKMSLIASAAAGAGKTAAVSSGAKGVFSGAAAGVKANIGTIIVATAIGVGSVATYEYVNKEPEEPTVQQVSIEREESAPARQASDSSKAGSATTVVIEDEPVAEQQVSVNNNNDDNMPEPMPESEPEISAPVAESPVPSGEYRYGGARISTRGDSYYATGRADPNEEPMPRMRVRKGVTITPRD